MTNSLLGLGAGGHAKVMVEILRQMPEYELVGLLDFNADRHGQTVHGVPVLGDDDLLPDLVNKGINHFFIGLGGTGNTLPRRRLYELAASHGMKPVDAIHPSAIVSEWAAYGPGVTLCAGGIVGADARLGRNVMVNTGAVVEHDCVVGDHVHIASRATLASTVSVGEDAHIGAGSTVRQCIRIGRGAIVGAGAVVVKDVPANAVVAGVPAEILRVV